MSSFGVFTIRSLFPFPVRRFPCRVFGTLLVLTLGVTLVVTQSACSTHSELYLREELANRGPIGLSGSNPYLSPNLFVANEMKHSEVFRGFVRFRGTPDAVEIRKHYFKPLRVYLFYLADGEAFLMEQGAADWLVRGPERIPTQLMSSFFNMQPPGQNAPLAVEDQVVTLPGEGSAHAPTDPAADVKSLRKVPSRAEVTGKKASPPNALKEKSELVSSVQESSSGDLIHRVSFAGESLRLIAQWYTGDINNTGRIARINGIENPDLLKIDQTVRIPRYLLRTTKPLPQAEVLEFNAQTGS